VVNKNNVEDRKL